MKVKYASITAENMEQSVKFYTEVMGFEVDSQYTPLPEVIITLLKGQGKNMIELIKNIEYESGLFSVGMEVNDLNTTVKELKSKGVKIIMEPVLVSVGSLAFLEDLNGAKIALIQHN